MLVCMICLNYVSLTNDFTALKAIKADTSEARDIYDHKDGKATSPLYEDGISDAVRSAFFKGRSICLLIRNRRLLRSELKRYYKRFDIPYRRLLCDMPVRWSSTHAMLLELLRQQDAITSMLDKQTWDVSVRLHLTPTPADWTILNEMEEFFRHFARPSESSQADKYATLHHVIPNYLILIRQMRVFKADASKPTLQKASAAALKVLEEYYKTVIGSRYAFIASITDPRYKLKVFGHLMAAEGGVSSAMYKRGEQHFLSQYNKYKSRVRRMKVHQEEEEEERAEELARHQPANAPVAREDGFNNFDPYEGLAEYLQLQENLRLIA